MKTTIKLIIVAILAAIAFASCGSFSGNEEPRNPIPIKPMPHKATKKREVRDTANHKVKGDTTKQTTTVKTTTTTSSTSASNTSASNTYQTPQAYNGERTQQISEILTMMFEIRLLELENQQGISKEDLSDNIKNAYSVLRTSPKVLIQMDHILAERNRALAEQLVLDWSAYKADTNLVDIVKMRELPKKRK